MYLYKITEKFNNTKMSRLETISEEFRKCTLILNSCRYTCGNEYCTGSADVISDGDCRGRDPKEGGAGSAATVGTNLDIACRKEMITKNGKLYTPGNEYSSATA